MTRRQYWSASAFTDGFEGLSWTGPADDAEHALERCRLAASTVYGPGAKDVTIGEAMPAVNRGFMIWKLMPGALKRAMGPLRSIEAPLPGASRSTAQACLAADAKLIGTIRRGEAVHVNAMAGCASGKPVSTTEILTIVGRCSLDGSDRDPREMISDRTFDRIMTLSLKTIVQLALSGRIYIGDGRHNAYARIEMPQSATLAATAGVEMKSRLAACEDIASAAMLDVGADAYA